MRNIDRHLAVNAGWFAGPAFGAAMTGAATYFEMSRYTAAALFWVGIGIFLCSTIIAIAVARPFGRGEHSVFWPTLVMVVGAILLCGGAAWYFWPTPSMAGIPADKIAIGILVFDSGQIEIRHKINTDKTAGRMMFVLRNATDKLIAFKALLYGDINGTLINHERKYFTGFIHPNERSKMFSDMVENLIIYNTASPGQPSIIGRLRYEIQYKGADEDNFYRETAKTLTYSGFAQMTEQAHRVEEPISILFSDSMEK